ncbi:ABC transporter permease [Symmachiella macrocystis]|nr:ABC transporter permease [Symmachiella macrocystis]
MRNARTHLLRAAFIIPVILFVYFAATVGNSIGAPGLFFFRPLTYLNFVLISLAGISLFSSAITEEKEEMTLGLLRMAGISPLALLLGKGTSRLFTVVLILSVQFPFTLLAETLGGVTRNQVFATYVALLAYTLLIANLGLFCSVFCRRSSRAALLTTICLALMFIGPSLLDALWNVVLALDVLTDNSSLPAIVDNIFLWLTEISVLNRLGTISMSGFKESPFSTQVIVDSVAAALLFLASWVSFDWFNREEISAAPPRGLLPRLSRKPGGKRSGMPRPWKHPLAWKDYHFIAGGRRLAIAKFIAYIAICGMITVFAAILAPNPSFEREEIAGLLMSVSLLGICLETSLMASRVFHDETKWYTLSNLVMLPISIPRMAYEKIAGCLWGLLPAATLLFAGAVCAPGNFGTFLADIITEPWYWVWIAQLIMFWHLIAWGSLQIKWGALPLAIAIVLFGDFITQVVIMTVILLINSPSRNAFANGEFIEYLLPVALTVGQLLITAMLHVGIGTQLKKQAAA